MWLYLPISVCSLEPEVSISPSESQFQMLAAFVSVSGKSVQPASLRRAWKTGVSMRLLSGVMYEPSLANSSVTAWLESLADSLALISPSPESERASPESTLASGLNTCASFAKCGPNGSLWRTSPQSSLFQQEELYLEGLPKAGSMRNGYLFGRPTWGHRTGGSGCSSSRGGENWGTPKLGTNNGIGQENPTRGSRIEDQAATWKTPHGMAGIDYTGKVGGGGEFAKQATNWPTPAANDDNKTPEAHLAMKQRMGERDGSHANRTAITSLAVKVQCWPSPRSEDSESCGNHPGAVDSLGGGCETVDNPAIS